MTPFRIEHVLRAPSAEVFWSVYFDEAHAATLDAETDIEEREFLERRDDGEILFRSMRLRPKRQLPGWFRKLTKKELAYTQNETFYRRDNRIEIEIIPTVFARKTQMTSVYTIEEVEPERFLRVFEGSVSINVPVFGSRIERSVVDDIRRSYEVGAAATQRRLDEVAAASG